MKTYVLFTSNPVNLPEWNKISNPAKYNIVLIINEKCFNALKESDKKLITKIYKIEDFGFENLRLIVEIRYCLNIKIFSLLLVMNLFY